MTKIYELLGTQRWATINQAFIQESARNVFVNSFAPQGNLLPAVISQPQKPSSTKLGTATIGAQGSWKDRTPATWKKYFEKTGGTYKPTPVSGVVEADKIAELYHKETITGGYRNENFYAKWAEENASKLNQNEQNLYEKWAKENAAQLDKNDNKAWKNLLNQADNKVDDVVKVNKTKVDVDKVDDVVKVNKTKIDVDKVDDVSNVVKKFNWKKALKYGGIVAAVGLTAGLIAWGIKKHKENKALEELISQITPPGEKKAPALVTGKGTPASAPGTGKETPASAPDTGKETPAPAPAPNLPLVDGKYTVVYKDSFWKIAERHLKDKYRNEPEKFENLSETERNIMIQLETRRIMEKNGYELDDAKWFPKPGLYPGDVLDISE